MAGSNIDSGKILIVVAVFLSISTIINTLILSSLYVQIAGFQSDLNNLENKFGQGGTGLLLAAGPYYFGNETNQTNTTCTAGYLNNYRCSGNWQQRQYIYSDCSTTWVNWQYCTYGCSNGFCAFPVGGNQSGGNLTNQTNQTKPDIVITDLAFNPSAPTTGNKVVITAYVKNQGVMNIPGYFRVRFEDITSKRFLGDTVISGLRAGQTKTTLASYNSITAGSHTIRATADFLKQIYESNEFNNVYSENLFVSGNQTNTTTCSKDPNYGRQCTVGIGACKRTGTYICNNPFSTTEKPRCSAIPGAPQTEICNDKIDNDCDAQTDCADFSCTGTSICAGNQTNTTCTAGYLNNYQCSGSWQQREYQYNTCAKTWVNWQYCTYGCSNGVCLQAGNQSNQTNPTGY